MALQWTSITFYTIASTLLLFLAKCVYNVCFHPLRNYPGPLLARATRLYHLYYDLTGVQHLKQKEWHDIYGEVVRVAPDELSYNSAQAWPPTSGSPQLRKGPGLFGGTEQFTDTHIVIANEKDHRRLRRLQSPAFSEKALMAQQDVIKIHTDRFIDQLRKRALLPKSSRNDNDNNNEQKSGEGEKVMNGHDDDDAGVVDMVQWLNFLLFDTTGDLAFGSPFGCLVEGVPSRYIDVIFGLVKFGNWYRAARRFPSPLKELIIIAVIPRNLINDQQFQLRISREKVEERMKRVTERPDFMSYFLRANEQNGMTLREIQAGASIFLIAGSETTATLLSGAFYLLLTNPKYLNRLTDEVRTTFKHESDINMQSTAGTMPFLQAVLQESLRLYPPAPNSFPRETPEPGEVVCGRFVPAKTAVGIHQWSANRSSRNFYLPDEFIPERWMGVDERFENDKRDASQPFSYGPRNCIGQNLAYAEMRLTMCRVLWNFDLELHDDSRNWMREQKTFTLWEKEPLKIRLRTASH